MSYISGRQIPDLKKFHRVGENKQTLIIFLCESIVQHHGKLTVTGTHEEFIYLADTAIDS